MSSSLLATLAGMVSDFATKSGGGDSVTSIGVYVLQTKKKVDQSVKRYHENLPHDF